MSHLCDYSAWHICENHLLITVFLASNCSQGLNIFTWKFAIFIRSGFSCVVLAIQCWEECHWCFPTALVLFKSLNWHLLVPAHEHWDIDICLLQLSSKSSMAHPNIGGGALTKEGNAGGHFFQGSVRPAVGLGFCAIKCLICKYCTEGLQYLVGGWFRDYVSIPKTVDAQIYL